MVQAKLAGCSQSRHLDRPWMTSLPQTELTVDCEVAEEPPARATSTSSPSSAKNGKPEMQQQQQLRADVDAGDIKASDSEPAIDPDGSTPADHTSHPAAGVGDDGKDDEDDVDGKTNPVYTCARCEKEFSDETRYEIHCKKCCDD